MCIWTFTLMSNHVSRVYVFNKRKFYQLNLYYFDRRRRTQISVECLQSYVKSNFVWENE